KFNEGLFNSGNQRIYKPLINSVNNVDSDSSFEIIRGQYTTSSTSTESNITPALIKRTGIISNTASDSSPILRRHVIELYNYYTDHAGAYIGFDEFELALSSKSETISDSDSISDGYKTLNADSYTLSESRSEGQTRLFVHNPKIYEKSEPIFIYDKNEQLQ